MDRKEIIRILTNAIKGEIPFDEFKRLFQNNEEIRNMFSENTKIHSALDLSHFHNNYLEFFNSFDWESIFDRADIIS